MESYGEYEQYRRREALRPLASSVLMGSRSRCISPAQHRRKLPSYQRFTALLFLRLWLMLPSFDLSASARHFLQQPAWQAGTQRCGRRGAGVSQSQLAASTWLSRIPRATPPDETCTPQSQDADYARSSRLLTAHTCCARDRPAYLMLAPAVLRTPPRQVGCSFRRLRRLRPTLVDELRVSSRRRSVIMA